MLLNIILTFALLVSLITDFKQRKILNIITLPTMVFALIYHTFTLGLEGFLFSGKGLLIGLCLLFLPYILGGMGAGDVKLMASIGSLMGVGFVFYSFIYSALIGGVIGLVLVIKQRGIINPLKSLLFNLTFFRSNLGALVLPTKEDKILFPYGVAIVLGTFCNLIWGGLL